MRRFVGFGICLVGGMLLVASPVEAVDAPLDNPAAAAITGELQQWHKVTLTLDGPQASEDGDPNPFLDYRLQVTFHHPATGLTYHVPGYFAADGDAANTSATSGNKWRAHLAPDHAGKWTYAVSFRAGPGVAVSEDADAGSAVAPVDGLSGSFEIAETDKTGRDLRAKGRLNYVGKHHLQFAGTGEYFLKCGADAPENFLAYADFDGDFKSDGHKDDLVKTWEPHVKDWKAGDPTWQDGKGKGIIGAVNYLASQGMNVFSFLTFNIKGDDCNAFPYINYDDWSRIDCSRMDQWAIVFEHGNNRGMYLHFKTMETENELLLDRGDLGPQRKLYYRELIARFAHNLALNWNLGEEINDASHEQKVAWAEYLWTHDPYQHHIVIHNMGDPHYDLLGDASALTGFSLQTSRPDFSEVHGRTLDYIRRSDEAGKPWVVACDEPGDAQHALITDAEDPAHDNARKNALWGNIMAGGAGVEWYFGYKHPHSDLTCQDYRSREKMWALCLHALNFFKDHEIPFWDMTSADELLDNRDAYCLCQAGKLYMVYLKQGGDTKLDLSAAEGMFEVRWFNPREGGPLLSGSAAAIAGGGPRSLGQPPRDQDQDWLALVLPADPNRNYPPAVNAGGDQTVMLARGEQTVTVELAGHVNDDGKPGDKVTCHWAQADGPGAVAFKQADSAATSVSLTGAGTYVLKLTASDGEQTGSDSATITVEPFSARVVRAFTAVEDAYIENRTVLNNQQLKVEASRRVAYLKFAVDGLPSRILSVSLELTEHGDPGSGTLRIYRGSHTDWTGATLQGSSAPEQGEVLGEWSGSVGNGETIKISVAPLITGVDGTYCVIIAQEPGGNDIWFGSSESGVGPKLIVTAEEPEGGDGVFKNVASNPAPIVIPTVPKTADDPMFLAALDDFLMVNDQGFVPSYKDARNRALAINAAQYQGKFAASEATYDGQDGTYDLVLTTLTETDGESTYRVFVDDKKIGEVQNPPAENDYVTVMHRFEGIAVRASDTIRVEFNSASNGKIPEGDGFAFSRGRWRSVAILEPGAAMKQPAPAAKQPAPAPVDAPPFEFTYDPTQAKQVHKQTDGIVVVEAEDYDAVDRQDHRKWYLTTADITPDVKPDPDPNHAEGASGGAYLEILPDTRVTHGDPLVNGVSFSNTPGQCSVLYYPVIIDKPGRYYVWVRTCCTGSEDNGLHVGIDGRWPESGARLQFTGQHGLWQWDSRQRTELVHTGVLGQIWLDIDQPGLHTIMFSMREDGFEFDKFLLTPDQKPMESKTTEIGPPASPKQ